MPAYTAGRKNPVAIPTTPASATIAAGLPANGSTQNTAARTRSETISRRRRERRSTSGANSRPIRMIGQEVRDQERADPGARPRAVVDVDGERDDREVRPMPDANVARKRRRKSGA